ncbi:MAG: ankyrin repeat domain-containing protein [Bryobacteraceae bacterium]|nr:ankyrin repeat domain-containing protein [Bryobacteraceae bacterium]
MNGATREFFEAIRGDDIFGLTTMLNRQPSLVDAINENGVCALMFATYYGRKEAAQLLIQSGAKVDVFTASALGDLGRLQQALAASRDAVTQHSADGWTALHLAAFFGKKDAAKALLAAGASVHARSGNAMNNHPLHAAAAGKSRDIVALLLEHGAHVNATQAAGWTPLHAAAQNGDAAMVNVLLAAGADKSLRADNGQSPLDLALGKGAQEVVDLLEPAP